MALMMELIQIALFDVKVLFGSFEESEKSTYMLGVADEQQRVGEQGT